MKKIIFIISLLGIFITTNAQEYVESKTFIPGNNANNAIGEKNAIWRNNIIAPPVGNNFPNSQNWWSIFQTQFNDTRYDAQLAFGLNQQDLWLRYNYDGNWKKWKQIILADHNGNVGIGTTSPSAKLEIKGAGDGVEILKLSTERPWVFKQEGTGASSNLVLQEISGNKFFKIKSYDNIDIYTIQSNSGNTYFKGNMGIGTANPNKKFQIRDGALMEMSLGTHQVNTGSKEPALFLSRWLGTGTLYQTHILHSLQSQGSYGLAFSLVGTHNHNDFSNYNTKMYLSQNGNLGIGTITPDAKLAVNGNIHTKEVKVDLVGWPDYVFENDYNLPTLQQVENHITEKGHLENIPSAAEVAENGIQLGEMNAKLLQKIEELTLYMIEQNKKTENLTKEVAALKQKNAELEQRMK